MKAAWGPPAGRQPAHGVHAVVRLVRFGPCALFGSDRTACSFSPDGADMPDRIASITRRDWAKPVAS